MAKSRLKRIILPLGAIILTMAMLLVSCADTNSKGRSRSKKDRDDDEEEEIEEETEEGETEEVETTKRSKGEGNSETDETTTEPEATPEDTTNKIINPDTDPGVTYDDVKEAYKEVLLKFGDNMRLVEDAAYASVPSCSYLDITNDGWPELIILYASDEEKGAATNGDYYICADMRFFTLDEPSGQAIEMLHVENAILNAGGGFFADSVLLDNGNIIVTTGWGDEESEYTITEYTVEGESLIPVNTLFCGFYLDDSSGDYDFYYSYEWNGSQISQDEYYQHKKDYIDQFNTVITEDIFYSYDWYSGDEWAEAIMSCPNSSMYIDDLWYTVFGN